MKACVVCGNDFKPRNSRVKCCSKPCARKQASRETTTQAIERRRKLKQKAIEYKGGKCERCGYNKCIQALEFHHLDKDQKDYGIAHASNKGWDSVRSELDKTIMVCANCHREIHFYLGC